MNRQRDARRPDRVRRRIVAHAAGRARGPGICARCCVALERLRSGSSTERRASRCASWPTSLRKRGLVVLISDLLDDPERVIRGLRHFQFRGTDVIVFQVLDPHETRVPVRAGDAVRDLETGEEVMAVPAVVRAALPRGDAGS